MAESSGMVGADTSIYNNKLFQQQPNDLGHLIGTANAMQQNKLLQAQVPLQINNAQLENSAKHLDYVNNYLAPLIGLGDKVGISDLTKAANDAATNSGGAISQQEANNFVQQIVTNPNGIQPALQQMHMRVLDGQAKIAAIRGVDTTTNTGGGTQLGNRNSFTGAYSSAPGGYLPTTKTVGEKMQRVETYQNGQPGTMPHPSDNMGNPVPIPSAPLAGQPATTTMNPRMAGSNFLPTAAPLGVASATEATAKAGADQGVQLQAIADQAPQRKASLQELEQLLKQTSTGPGAGNMAKAGAMANMGAEIMGISPLFNVADKELLGKITSQLQQAQGAVGGTDAARALAGLTNPNLSLSTEGNKRIIQLLKGQEDAVTAKSSAWQEWKKTHGPDTYSAFQDDFNKSYEPRAFVFPYLSADERTKMMSSMTPNERAQVKNAIMNAEKRGWIKAPGN